jgi:hypothetical protein
MSSSETAADINKRQALCLDALRSELTEIVQISLKLSKSMGFLKSRLKTPFPKKCSKCAKEWDTFEDFFQTTHDIARGTVSYPILGNDFYMHRNCPPPCDTTLVVVFVDRRDETPAGFRRRELFEVCMNRLRTELIISRDDARDILLAELANELSIEIYKEANGNVPKQEDSA